jgi:predicted nucleic acid-binding protein
MELAVAGGAAAIITNNVRDLKSGELIFPDIEIMTPSSFLKTPYAKATRRRP